MRRDGEGRAGSIAIYAAFFAAKFALLASVNGRYGLFRDELYYLDCARHLGWGYVDHPPLSIAVLWISTQLFGDGFWGVRLPGYLAGCATVVLAGMLTRAIGGGRFAQLLVCTAMLFSPVYLALASFYSMNPIDHVFWLGAVLVLVKLIETEGPRWWLLFGAVCGLGLMNKLSVIFLGAAVVGAMTLTPLRAQFRSPYLYLGGVVALVLVLPNVVWQIVHGFPTLEFMHNAALYKNRFMPPHEFLLAQVVEAGPFNAPIWIAGVVFGVRHALVKPYRPLMYVFVLVLAFFLVTTAKPYYLASALPIALAFGCVAWERWSERRVVLRAGYLSLMVVLGVALLPLSLPVLPPETAIAFHRAIGIGASHGENTAVGELPQHFADRFGWRELADLVADAYEALPAAEQGACIILTNNYGEASAINCFARDRGLPRASSGHNNHFLWGPGENSGEVALVFDDDEARLREIYREVTEVGRLVQPYAMPFEHGRPLYLCRGLKHPVAALWPDTKIFI